MLLNHRQQVAFRSSTSLRFLGFQSSGNPSGILSKHLFTQMLIMNGLFHCSSPDSVRKRESSLQITRHCWIWKPLVMLPSVFEGFMMKLRVIYEVWNPLGNQRTHLEIFLSLLLTTNYHKSSNEI